MIELKPHAEGVVVSVRAVAGAKRSEVRGEQNGALKVTVTQAAEKGKANKAIAALLVGALGLRKTQVELLWGATSRNKQFLLRDVLADDAARRIERLE